MSNKLPQQNLCVRGNDRERGSYDVVIYGHTHRAEIKQGDSLMINPGECGGWLEGKSTVALLDLESMQAELIKL